MHGDDDTFVFVFARHFWGAKCGEEYQANRK